MILKLKSSLLFIITSVLFFSCQKEYSLEGKLVGGTAVFTFTGAPGPCSNPVVTGAYQAGTALGATNLVSLSVNVATAGTYTISTTTVNGISFSGSGTFAGTGAQTIILTGTGIPAAAGTSSFTPGTNGCAFSVIITGGGGGSGTAVFTYAGGTAACTSAIPAGTYATGTALAASNTVVINVTVTTIGTYSISTPVVNGYSFAGSGNFTATGAQTVTLRGTGTPVAAGVDSFKPTGGCSFPVTVVTGTVVTDFIRCTIDSVARTFNLNLAAINPDPTTFAFGGDENATATTPTFEINLTKTPAVNAGTYNRPSLTNLTTFSLGIYDDGVTATTWASGLVFQPTGFTVIVTSFTATRIQGTFSGTLYDNDGQGTAGKVITAGSFSVPY